MKNGFLFLLLAAVLSLPIFSQALDPPTDWLQVVEGFSGWFGSFIGIAALGTFVTGFVNGIFNVSSKAGKQLLAWLVCIILTVIGHLVSFGFLGEATWLMTILYGLGAGLAANGIFNAPLIHSIILAIEQALKKEE